MSEPDLNNTILATEIDSTEALEQISTLVAKIPQAYLPKLLQMIRLFREIVVVEQESSANAKLIAFSQLPQEERVKRNQAAIALLNSWVEEGDEQEQKETWEILDQALNESGVSI
ncbi:hypothetical protein [Coleofasciculus sp. E1-EBD-02]|jgi:hypothetical protein|uniref:hypothetical protein n=1 Tax=Coleofasciculus sp. E1-EBD-02 TaxID=3068481 RepID=UPI0032F8A50D